MPQGRQYSEEEIARIFKDAAIDDASDGSNGGLSLSELKEIGNASGLSEAAIARAAFKLDHSFKLSPRKKFLGKVVGVGGRLRLGARMNDDDWSRLVAELRSVFDAKGELAEDRGLREWRNGNLRIIVSSGDTEDVLRMTTMNERKRGSRGLFVALTVVGGFLILLSFIGVFFEYGFTNFESISHFFEILFQHNDAGGALAVGLMQFAAGIFGLNFNGRSLSEWADEREEQMQEIGSSLQLNQNSGNSSLMEGLNYNTDSENEEKLGSRERASQ